MQSKAKAQGSAWKATSVQFLYRHHNRRYYVRTYSGGKEKWTSLKTVLLSVAKNRMKEHVGAAERQRASGGNAVAAGEMTFGHALAMYQESLRTADIRPNTKAFREAGVKLVLRTWPEVEAFNVRRITAKSVEAWLRNLKATARPHVPPRAKRATHNSTGSSVTTLKCALDAVRHILDVAVTNGHLFAHPARNASVAMVAKAMFKVARRARSVCVTSVIPKRDEFIKIVETIRNAGVSECRGAAEFVQFIAFCGARKTEAIHALWSDIDFGGENIRLRVTKNGEVRLVPMVADMRQLLEEMQSTHRNTAASDRVLLVKEAQGFIDSACRKHRTSRFTTHALRHLFATTCIEAGVDVRTVAGWLGHKDNGALLLKIYSHLRDEHARKMIRKVSFATAKSPFTSRSLVRTVASSYAV